MPCARPFTVLALGTVASPAMRRRGYAPTAPELGFPGEHTGKHVP
jgi:hypothetical protein